MFALLKKKSHMEVFYVSFMMIMVPLDSVSRLLV